jgi:HrpA-like RNA helicase
MRLSDEVTAPVLLLFRLLGVLLRRLQDPQCLAGISHVILDEVHERGVSSML